ncbi:pyridoxamine 5'-phosphate oxidase family protein [Nonomuraea sp. NPDC050310]|uniref:pyridoxamine 5'-phosphate oxidase family protein n=1 Tax=unclassified Nonomuraea TaxID=2593643 RepID=UPI00340AC9D2
MSLPPARSAARRKADTLHRLEHDVDAWIATAGAEGGEPYLVPLSFLWDGRELLISTAAAAPTSRNLLAGGKVRIGLGLTRDVILVEGVAEAFPATEISAEEGDAFAVKTGFDPRELSSPYTYFRVRPETIQAWREVNELAGRVLMRDGRWLVD